MLTVTHTQQISNLAAGVNSLPGGDFWIADPTLAEIGMERIRIARLDMPGIVEIVDRHYLQQPLSSARIAVSVIPTDATGNLVWALQKLGASVRVCSDNRVSTSDEVAAALVAMNVPVFARRNQSKEQYQHCFSEVVKFPQVDGSCLPPHQVIDDGLDLVKFIHESDIDLATQLRGATEQTTCGVNFAHALLRARKLACPIININAGIKAEFDNRYGTRESFIHSFLQCMNVELGGKVAVVTGFGPVGRGCIDQLRAVGAQIVVVDADPIRAAQALMEGHRVDSIESASEYGDIFVVSTGTPYVITQHHLLKMKSGAVLCNMGENYLEYDSEYLHSDDSIVSTKISDDLTTHRLPNGNELFSLADGGLMNMRGGGHPPRLLSITFSLHIMMQIALTQIFGDLESNIYAVPRSIQEEVVLLNFPELRSKLTSLTKEQIDYMGRDLLNPFVQSNHELPLDLSGLNDEV